MYLLYSIYVSLFLDLIFPKTCYFCHRHGFYFCPACLQNISVNPTRIRHCQPFSGVINLFPYHSGLVDAIHDLKYNFVSDIVPDIAQMMFTTLQSNFPNLLNYWRTQKFVVTSVSLFPYRQNWRGFNQSDLIAVEFCRLSGLKYQPNLVLRLKNNPSQVSQPTKISRLSNVKNIFGLNSALPLSQNIIIFDDVCTTMSTLKSCCQPLLSSDVVKEIWGLTLAGHF